MSADEGDIYLNGTYTQVMGSGSLARMWNRIHRSMEAPYRSRSYSRILEVGAGSGEHLPHVLSSWVDYHLTDVRLEPLLEGGPFPDTVHVEQEDVQSLTYPTDHFDRVILSCVLPHVPDPVRSLAEVHRVAAPGCDLTIYVPCEPGIALRAARAIVTIPRNKKLGVHDPYYGHFREHVHYFSALNHYIHREFAADIINERSYPFRHLGWNANLYRIYHIKIAKSAPASS
jgi:SAM-dependent methyltransferase